VSVYEAFRQKNIAGHFDKPQLTNEIRQELSTQWGFEDSE